jgi:hypothetical protein
VIFSWKRFVSEDLKDELHEHELQRSQETAIGRDQKVAWSYCL